MAKKNVDPVRRVTPPKKKDSRRRAPKNKPQSPQATSMAVKAAIRSSGEPPEPSPDPAAKQGSEMESGNKDGSRSNFEFIPIEAPPPFARLDSLEHPALGSERSAGNVPQDAGELEHLLEDERAVSSGVPSETVSLDKLLGGDDRVQVANPSLYPYHCVCYLLIETKRGRLLAGTGWLMAPRLLVTAGHCVYRRDEEDFVQSIRVFRGGSSLDGCVQAGKRFFVSGTYPTSPFEQAAGVDYGAVVLDEPFAGTGTLGVGVYPDTLLEGELFSVLGFPADKPARTLWHHARPLSDTTPRILRYQIDTYAGMDGAPVMEVNHDQDEPHYVVAGIHAGSIKGRPLNQACRITDEVWDNLSAWQRTTET